MVTRRLIWRVIGVFALTLGALACSGGDEALELIDTVPPTTSDDTDLAENDARLAIEGGANTSVSSNRKAPWPFSLRAIYKQALNNAKNPLVLARPAPPTGEDAPTATIATPPWADETSKTGWGHTTVGVGCAESLDPASLDKFLAARVGPVLGWDYQHIYPLGNDRYLWLFQDTFMDYTNTVDTLRRSRFVHNAALIQTGTCFNLMYGGTPNAPQPFEIGDGSTILKRWFWPMGGEMLPDGRLGVFWAEMVKDSYDPKPPDGLGWHPNRTYLATYDANTMQRLSFDLAANPGVRPIYGYAVASNNEHTYLFGNTFEQNLVREGGFWKGPHSATTMWLARVPRGQLAAHPEYRTADGWSPNPADAAPIMSRYHAENPFQPRFLDGQWVAATAVDGYWGDQLAIDVAYDPWGPWYTVGVQPLLPRGADPLMNTYHAHLLPWRGGNRSIGITVSNNARDMLADAWPHPHRYRPNIFAFPFVETPPTTTTTLIPIATLPPIITEAPIIAEPPTTLPPIITEAATTTQAPTISATTTTTQAPPIKVTTTTTRAPTTSVTTTTTTTQAPTTTSTSSPVSNSSPKTNSSTTTIP